jgi:hypothetical protein
LTHYSEYETYKNSSEEISFILNFEEQYDNDYRRIMNIRQDAYVSTEYLPILQDILTENNVNTYGQARVSTLLDRVIGRFSILIGGYDEEGVVFNGQFDNQGQRDGIWIIEAGDEINETTIYDHGIMLSQESIQFE